MLPKNYIIIGAGPAGLKCAQVIRRRNSSARITVLTDEPPPLYSRTLLISYVIDNTKDIFYRSEIFLKRQDINIRFNTAVLDIDTDKNFVVTDGGKLYYDYLTIASGGEAIIPKIEFENPECVFIIRKIKDAVKIRKHLINKKNVVIVGTGLIGMELANVLNDKQITLLEKENQILPNILDKTAADILLSRLKLKRNISLMTNITVQSVKNSFVVLSNGEKLKYDIIIFAIGVKPQISFLHNTKIKRNVGIIADRFMRTNIENIYCCGDCAEVYDSLRDRYLIHANWINAIRQAEISALNSCGESVPHNGYTNVNTTRIFNLSIFSIGLTKLKGEMVYFNPEKNYYEKYVKSNGKIFGYLKITPDDYKTDLKYVGLIANIVGKELISTINMFREAEVIKV